MSRVESVATEVAGEPSETMEVDRPEFALSFGGKGLRVKGEDTDERAILNWMLGSSRGYLWMALAPHDRRFTQTMDDAGIDDGLQLGLMRTIRAMDRELPAFRVPARAGIEGGFAALRIMGTHNTLELSPAAFKTTAGAAAS